MLVVHNIERIKFIDNKISWKDQLNPIKLEIHIESLNLIHFSYSPIIKSMNFNMYAHHFSYMKKTNVENWT